MNHEKCFLKLRNAGSCLLVILLCAYIQQFQLSASVIMPNRLCYIAPKWQLLNGVIAATPMLLILFLSRRLDIAVLVSSILMTVLSLISYHVLVFHGSPFLAGDIYSIGAAINVLDSYRLILDGNTGLLCVPLLLQLGIWGLLRWKADWFRLSFPRLALSVPLAADIICIALCFFVPHALFSNTLISWNWLLPVREYGYGICLYNSINTLTHAIAEPENYSVDNITPPASVSADTGARPDIILIMNESLYDIDLCGDIPESADIFRRMREIPGVSWGYAIAPSSCGGTNNSEFELLTSNSLSLLRASAPFSSMSMKGVNSIVSYLNDLDYTTAALHCGAADNYGRNRAYPDLGFDNVVLGPAAFSNRQVYGNRLWFLDSENYKDMMEWHEIAGGPRFTYLLTLQNHGGYKLNDSSYDTFHVSSTRFGDLTDEINEYLTSIDMSADAFAELIAQLDSYDRPLVLLMVGDHSPAFASQLLPEGQLSDAEREILLRQVPYFVWSNTDFDDSQFPEFITMTDLIPRLLKASGMPMSPYYETILELGQTLPVRTSTGYYRDYRGQYGTISANPEYAALVSNYHCMAYNNLAKQEDYQAEWFLPRQNPNS